MSWSPGPGRGGSNLVPLHLVPCRRCSKALRSSSPTASGARASSSMSPSARWPRACPGPAGAVPPAHLVRASTARPSRGPGALDLAAAGPTWSPSTWSPADAARRPCGRARRPRAAPGPRPRCHPRRGGRGPALGLLERFRRHTWSGPRRRGRREVLEPWTWPRRVQPGPPPPGPLPTLLEGPAVELADRKRRQGLVLDVKRSGRVLDTVSSDGLQAKQPRP